MATFNYSSKSSIKDNLTEILVGAGLIIVPVVYPFGIKVGTLRILGPLPTAIILALVGLYMLFRAWRKIHKARKLAAKSCIITVDGDKVTYPVIVTITLANGSTAKFDVDFFDGLPQLKEFAALLKK